MDSDRVKLYSASHSNQFLNQSLFSGGAAAYALEFYPDPGRVDHTADFGQTRTYPAMDASSVTQGLLSHG